MKTTKKISFTLKKLISRKGAEPKILNQDQTSMNKH